MTIPGPVGAIFSIVVMIVVIIRAVHADLYGDWERRSKHLPCGYNSVWNEGYGKICPECGEFGGWQTRVARFSFIRGWIEKGDAE